jgi:hypothetical protein
MKCLYTICRKGNFVDKGEKVNMATSILQKNLQLRQKIKEIPYSIIVFPVLVATMMCDLEWACWYYSIFSPLGAWPDAGSWPPQKGLRHNTVGRRDSDPQSQQASGRRPNI